MSDETKFLALIQSQQQGAKRNRAGASRGPSSDNGIDGIRDLQLHPIRTTIGNVGAVSPLRDNSFQTILSCQFKQFFPALQLVVGVAEAFGGVQQPLQELFAFQQRSLAKIVSIAIKKIEGEVNDRNLRDKMVARSTHVHAFLQELEVIVPGRVESNNFSIDDCLASSQGFRKRCELGIAFGNVHGRAGT